jgi:hypothetical protein
MPQVIDPLPFGATRAVVERLAGAPRPTPLGARLAFLCGWLASRCWLCARGDPGRLWLRLCPCGRGRGGLSSGLPLWWCFHLPLDGMRRLTDRSGNALDGVADVDHRVTDACDRFGDFFKRAFFPRHSLPLQIYGTSCSTILSSYYCFVAGSRCPSHMLSPAGVW